MMNTSSLRLILFDIDCTLLLTHGAGREATRRAMLEVFGTSGNIEKHHFGGKTDWQTLVELLGQDEAAIGKQMPVYDPVMGRHLAEVIPEFPVIRLPGALELVEALRQRDDLVLGLVTGNVSSSVPVKLRAAGFDPDWFAVGAYGSEAMNRDHLPALAIERAGHLAGQPFSPEQVIVVGDTPADVSCARAVGAAVVAVRTGFCQPGELEAAAPDYLLDDLTTFLEAVTL
jgi:phosphoglycolate phosphatase-like HAD superfamily hydrolase